MYFPHLLIQMAALAHTQEQFLDNKTWQTKLHRVYMENIELRDSIEQLKADQIHLNETVNLLKTELCGRYVHIFMYSKNNNVQILDCCHYCKYV